MRNIKLFYFSPTGTTEKIVKEVGRKISINLSGKETSEIIDFTLPKNRVNSPSFSKKDLIVVGVPVYAGRVPNVLLKYLKNIEGNGALAVAIVLFGNRNYDDALIELQDILSNNDFKVIAAGAFIGEHSFSKTLGQDRPDNLDLEKARIFGEKIFNKIKNSSKEIEEFYIKENREYSKYYIPLGKEGKPADIRKVVPKTNSNCTDCKICAEICPMGSINFEDVTEITGICIKCCACIKRCPMEAKYFDDLDFIIHKKDLEVTCIKRKEPEIFIYN